MKLILAAVTGAKWKRSLDVLGTEVKEKDIPKRRFCLRVKAEWDPTSQV
jgi:hypothetical protein